MPGLVEELSLALERMVDATCSSMGALWLSATRKERSELSRAMPEPIFVPAGFARFKKAKRSKYEALATFRHTVVWRLPSDEWSPESPAGQEYFVRCRDAPPFTAGGTDARSTRGKTQGAAVSAHLIALIKSVRLAARKQDKERRGNDLHVAGALAAKAVRRSLRDVLKLDDPEFTVAFDEALESTE